jgi:hypothetical protein
MADRAVLIDDHEVVPLLESMQLDKATLIEVVRYAAAERALCTSNDLRGFDLITMNAKIVRGLRDKFGGKNWVSDEVDNQEGIRNEALKLRIIACNFDHHAGSQTADPTNLVAKGSASDKKALCNATAFFPGFEIPSQDGEEIVTWVLGTHVGADGVVRAELSLPLSFVNKQYARFEKRVILLTGNEPEGREPIRRAPDREGPVEIVDIAIRRK